MTHDLQTTYRGKRVFLTGHTGFKGTWLMMVLHELGAEVKGYSLAPKNDNDLYWQVQGDDFCQSEIADIRDRERLRASLLEFQPDFVFHLAAQALVLDSYAFPVDTYETNVMGTVYLLDALRSLDKPCTTVLITTDKVYENKEWHTPYPEDAPLGGYDPYSNSKACAELSISAYRNSFFHPSRYDEHRQGIASARSGNVIGGGDWSLNRLVPDIARALLTGTPIQLRNPSAVRPWQHVLDPLHGYLQLGARLAAEPQAFAQGYNFGPEPTDERTVEDMCELCIECWGEGSYKVLEQHDKPHEAGLLKLNIEKAKKELGWTPRFHSEEAVRWTMSWYQHAEGDERAYTAGQIKQYFSL